MKKRAYILTFTFLALLLLGIGFLRWGSRHSSVGQCLDKADSLMADHPDSALAILNALLPDTVGNGMSKPTLMRYHLLRTNARNKCDTVLGAADLAHIQLAAEHYDKDGTPNERMLAHYLAGRCYADMGEAPAALREYNISLERCDTIGGRCDYGLLSNLFFQTARLYLYQMLLPEAISFYRKAASASIHNGDTVGAVSCMEHTASAYYMKSDFDSVLIVCQQVRHAYQEMDDDNGYFNAVPLMAQAYLDKGDASRAGECLREYESESGMFDEHGVISRGHELYYSIRGDYMMAIGDYAQAQRDYRLLLQASDGNLNRLEAASKGLFKVFSKLDVPDSVAKYAQLYCNANDSSYSHTRTMEMARSKSMYDYRRIERVAEEKSIEAVKSKNTLLLIATISSIALCILAVLVAYLAKRRRDAVLENVRQNVRYSNLLTEYEALKKSKDSKEEELNMSLRIHEEALANMEESISLYRSKHSDDEKQYQKLLSKYAVSKKEMERIKKIHVREMVTLEGKIEELRSQLSIFSNAEQQKSPYTERDNVTMSVDIVKQFRQHALTANVPSERKWKELEKLVMENQPSFYGCITATELALTDVEIRLAILIRLQFIVSECCILLDRSSQSITNIRSSINKKLFRKSGTKGLDTQIRTL